MPNIFIARYGLTKETLVEGKGPFDSDIADPEGIVHARLLARRLKNDSDESNRPTLVISSPFLRATHTASLIAEELGCRHVIEDGVSEWAITDLLGHQDNLYKPRSVAELHDLFHTIDPTYESVNTSIVFPESEKELLQRCGETIEKLIKVYSSENILICSHAPCNQALALALEGLREPKKSKIGAWPLGGLTQFSRENNDESWKMVLNCDTQHMPEGEYRSGAKPWSMDCFKAIQARSCSLV